MRLIFFFFCLSLRTEVVKVVLFLLRSLEETVYVPTFFSYIMGHVLKYSCLYLGS